MKIFVTGGNGFIGTNFLLEARRLGHEILNYDRAPPQCPSLSACWCQGNLLDAESLSRELKAFQPDWLLHLAARTEMDENTTVEKGFQDNTTGTRNLLQALRVCTALQRVIITSSQFVVGPGPLPQDDLDFRPHTVYGASKVITEQLTRELPPPCAWTIIRPTNVWGPFHSRYEREFWRVLQKGWYLHPDLPSPTRSYAYVGNVVWQTLGLFGQPAAAVHEKVFYVGDRPVNILEWIQGFHRALSPRKSMLKIPFPVMRLVAVTGDLISACTRRPFYITSSRLKSMTTDYLTPMDPVIDLLGPPPFSMEAGIAETALWLRQSRTLPSKPCLPL